MARTLDERKTLRGAADAGTPTAFEKSSAAAAADVDILDSELDTALGFEPTTDQFVNDYDVKRVAHTTSADEAAATISIASVLRNAGDDGFTVAFSAAAAATKVVRVRVIPR